MFIGLVLTLLISTPGASPVAELANSVANVQSTLLEIAAAQPDASVNVIVQMMAGDTDLETAVAQLGLGQLGLDHPRHRIR